MVPISIQWLVPLAFGIDMALSGVKYCVIGLTFKNHRAAFSILVGFEISVVFLWCIISPLSAVFPLSCVSVMK